MDENKPITFMDALIEGMLNKEFVSNYDRIMQAHLGGCIKNMNAANLNHEIDKATGFFKAEVVKFSAFFYETVWSRLPEEIFVKQ